MWGVARRAKGGRVKFNLGEGEPKKVAVGNVANLCYLEDW